MEHVTVQGVDVPAIGMGTWRLQGRECREAVRDALELGYRHVDTAQAYDNESDVGAAIEASDVDRDDLFVATKLDGDHRAAADVRAGVEASLDRLGLDRVDLLYVHWPNEGMTAGALPDWLDLPGRFKPDSASVSTGETLDAMAELREEGKVDHVGVSNFGLDRLRAARRRLDAPLFADQVQYHPYWDQSELLDYCVREDVLLTAYSPLGQGGVLDDDRLERIGRRYGKSPAQVAIRWLVQQPGVCAIPKATSRDHLAANLDVFDFELTDAEMLAVHQPSKLRTAAGIARGQGPF
ncbi:aldo/keto reductase [Candidatus Halobonum tyrrellensis]|uniref:Aldo/keto reductase family oxidoreductase n=1 Tax=Candidatus Halobonum tyrrellensis G22 TaxID=1324957 RepID=V4GV86_9EURY|nr:aldo/keto reductase [Candidatus Halobonum tyrrellensis]ESP89071.1 aldo/keto reductase family oxidoreductase [Candidatus Halobonum tyrrellensis G22]